LPYFDAPEKHLDPLHMDLRTYNLPTDREQGGQFSVPHLPVGITPSASARPLPALTPPTVCPAYPATTPSLFS